MMLKNTLKLTLLLAFGIHQNISYAGLFDWFSKGQAIDESNLKACIDYIDFSSDDVKMSSRDADKCEFKNVGLQYYFQNNGMLGLDGPLENPSIKCEYENSTEDANHSKIYHYKRTGKIYFPSLQTITGNFPMVVKGEKVFQAMLHRSGDFYYNHDPKLALDLKKKCTELGGKISSDVKYTTEQPDRIAAVIFHSAPYYGAKVECTSDTGFYLYDKNKFKEVQKDCEASQAKIYSDKYKSSKCVAVGFYDSHYSTEESIKVNLSTSVKLKIEGKEKAEWDCKQAERCINMLRAMPGNVETKDFVTEKDVEVFKALDEKCHNKDTEKANDSTISDAATVKKASTDDSGTNSAAVSKDSTSR